MNSSKTNKYNNLKKDRKNGETGLLNWAKKCWIGIGMIGWFLLHYELHNIFHEFKTTNQWKHQSINDQGGLRSAGQLKNEVAMIMWQCVYYWLKSFWNSTQLHVALHRTELVLPFHIIGCYLQNHFPNSDTRYRHVNEEWRSPLLLSWWSWCGKGATSPVHFHNFQQMQQTSLPSLKKV